MCAQNDGVLALWRGNSWNLLKVGGYVLLVYGAGELTRKYLEQRRSNSRYMLGLVGGAAVALYSVYRFGFFE